MVAHKRYFRRRHVLAVSLCWLVYLLVLCPIYVTHPDGAGDFVAYDGAARALNRGDAIYTDLYVGVNGEQPYIYPPLLAIMLAPVTAVTDAQGSALFWLGLNVALLAGALALLARDARSKREMLFLWLAPLMYAPVLMSFWHGQATILMFALVVGAWRCYRRGQHGWAGALLALGAWIKIYPVILIAYFVLRRDWRVLRGTLITGAALLAVQVAVAGWDNFYMYIGVILPDLALGGKPNLFHAHPGITGFAARLFTDVNYVAPVFDSPAGALILRLILTAIVVFIPLALILRRRDPHREHTTGFDLEYALVLTSALLLTSSISESGLIPLLFVYGVILSTTHGQSTQTWARYACLASLLLSPVVTLLQLAFVGAVEVQIPALALSTSFFGTMILWGTCAYLLAKVRTAQPTIPVSETARATGVS